MDFLEKLKPISLLLLRCVLGVIFFAHGYPRLFGHATSHISVAHLETLLHYAMGIIELFGGTLIVLGLFTRSAALLLTIDVSLAVWRLVDAGNSLAIHNYEFPLVLGAASLALATFGAGVLSMDQVFFAGGRKAKSTRTK